jgi:hypothetical protein
MIVNGIVGCTRGTPDKEVDVSQHRIHLRKCTFLALVVAVAAGVIVATLALAGCGSKSDFPGSYKSARGEEVKIAARADGDYDVTFLDPGPQGQDMTFQLTRGGDKLTYDDGDYFIYVTFSGDNVTIERIGNIQTYLRQK